MSSREFGRAAREEAKVASSQGGAVKRDLNHLPAAKREELAHVVEVLQASLAKALETRRAVDLRFGRILKIILFGSYARGDWVEDPVGRYYSDFDLLVVVSDEKLTDTWEFWEDAESQLLSDLASGQRLRTPVSFIVHSLDDVNHQLERGRYFWVDVMREGVLLVDTPGVEFAPVQPMPVDVALAEAEAFYEEAMHFVERHLTVYRVQAQQGAVDARWRKDAAFTLHQTAEHLYHALLMVFTLYVPKSHNLVFLRKRTDAFDGRLRDIWPGRTKFERRCFELLRAAYVKARYSRHYKVSDEELAWMAERIEVLRDVVSVACSRRLEEMRRSAGV